MIHHSICFGFPSPLYLLICLAVQLSGCTCDLTAISSVSVSQFTADLTLSLSSMFFLPKVAVIWVWSSHVFMFSSFHVSTMLLSHNNRSKIRDNCFFHVTLLLLQKKSTYLHLICSPDIKVIYCINFMTCRTLKTCPSYLKFQNPDILLLLSTREIQLAAKRIRNSMKT